MITTYTIGTYLFSIFVIVDTMKMVGWSNAWAHRQPIRHQLQDGGEKWREPIYRVQ